MDSRIVGFIQLYVARETQHGLFHEKGGFLIFSRGVVACTCLWMAFYSYFTLGAGEGKGMLVEIRIHEE